MPLITELRPRAMVADLAWRALGTGLEPLSGPGGAPLTRTVKLIVLPLVIRPSLRPELAGEFLDAQQAAQFEKLLADAGPALEATARWFTVLKKTRRALGIVGGNPQDLYFQLCFELATEHGNPPADPGELATAALRDVAEASGGRTVDALKDHLLDPARHARLEAELAAAWADRGLGTGDEEAAAALAAEVLDGTGSFTAMVDHAYGSVVGRALWTREKSLWGNAELPVHLGLTSHGKPDRPEVGRGASTATLPAPLDRTLFERLFVELQTSSARREELPPVPELARREVGRSCAPFGLDDESLRVAMVLGGQLAAGLDPLGGGAVTAQTSAHRAVNRRWQREASALRARRMTASPDPDGGALAALAGELRTPWAAYMRRLWVRLHGRDVRAASLGDPGSAWEVLDGVVRSVMMDHRTKVRSALRALSGSV
jgi:hypothetical protein